MEELNNIMADRTDGCNSFTRTGRNITLLKFKARKMGSQVNAGVGETEDGKKETAGRRQFNCKDDNS